VRKKAAQVKETYLIKEDSIEIDGFLISRGDIIKIQGEHGVKFKFHSFVTNSVSGAQWIDCFEFVMGRSSVFRSFSPDRVKRIPVKRKRVGELKWPRENIQNIKN
jgi:hypothetical protein